MSVPSMFKVPMNLLFSTGLPAAENIIYQASHENLIKDCLRKNEGALNEEGIFVAKAGNVNDATSMTVYVVKNAVTGNTIECNGSSKPIDATIFLQLYQKIIDHFDKKQIWIRDAFILDNSGQKVNIRSINEDPLGNLFVQNMFCEPSENELKNFNPGWYLIHAPGFLSDSAIDDISEKNFFMVNYETKTILIGGENFTTNIKHRVLSILTEHSI